MADWETTRTEQLTPAAMLEAYPILHRAQVRNILGITNRTLDGLVRRGLLPPVKIGAFNHWKSETVRAYLDDLKPTG
jgi:predicted DNA-binding transcriptional regulator AlpA